MKQPIMNRFVSAVFRHLGTGLRNVDDKEYARRLAICKSCPQWRKGWICAVCGCLLKVKARWASESCPLDPPKWPALDDSGHGKKGCQGCPEGVTQPPPQ